MLAPLIDASPLGAQYTGKPGDLHDLVYAVVCTERLAAMVWLGWRLPGKDVERLSELWQRVASLVVAREAKVTADGGVALTSSHTTNQPASLARATTGPPSASSALASAFSAIVPKPSGVGQHCATN